MFEIRQPIHIFQNRLPLHQPHGILRRNGTDFLLNRRKIIRENIHRANGLPFPDVIQPVQVIIKPHGADKPRIFRVQKIAAPDMQRHIVFAHGNIDRLQRAEHRFQPLLERLGNIMVRLEIAVIKINGVLSMHAFKKYRPLVFRFAPIQLFLTVKSLAKNIAERTRYLLFIDHRHAQLLRNLQNQISLCLILRIADLTVAH